MHIVPLVVYAIATFAVASMSDFAGANPSQHTTLLERAVGHSTFQRETRPTGQCIVSCDGRMIALKRCPDGDCPKFDCRTGALSCSSR